MRSTCRWLLKDAPYTRAETLVLVHLRTVYQRESAAGEGIRAHRHRRPRADGAQLLHRRRRGARPDSRRPSGTRWTVWIERASSREETSGRYRISALVEVVLSAEDPERASRLAAVAGSGGTMTMVDTLFGLIPRGVAGTAVGRGGAAADQLGRIRRRPPSCALLTRRDPALRGFGFRQVHPHGCVHRLDDAPHDAVQRCLERRSDGSPSRRRAAEHPLLRAREDR